MENTKECPCGRGLFKDCCGPILAGKNSAESPEELMRSRYSAFALGDTDYIAKTMIGPALMGFDLDGLKESLKKIKYKKLEVLGSSHDGDRGMVEFRAFYQIGDEKFSFHERSEFIEKDGKWFYFDGKML